MKWASYCKEWFIPVVFILLAALVFNNFWSYKTFTLYEDGKWESGKTKLKKGVIAAWCTVFTKAALSKNELNISAWSGYQELVYKKSISANAIQFRCQSFNRPFCFYTNKTDSFSEGLYFNYTWDTLCCFFRENNAGQFISKQDFTIKQELQNNKWNAFECRLKDDSLDLFINKKHFGKWPLSVSRNNRVGFRGSAYEIYVDEVSFTNAQGEKIIIDDFSPPFHINWQAVLLLIFLILLTAYFEKRRVCLSALCLVVIAAFYLVYFFKISARYEQSDQFIDFKGVSSNIETGTEICERLRIEYPPEKLAGKKKVILFIGTSQTWGAGISFQGKTMPEMIEDTLRKYFNDSSIVAINCGISGSTSDRLFPIYKSEWIKYKPVLTVINLSSNDADTAIFRSSIQQFLLLNQAQNINTLLVAEPNDLHHNEQLAQNHLILKQEAAKFRNCSFAGVQGYMDSCNTNGFIWWDYVHMTDYGYQLFSEKITSPVIKALESSE